MTKKHITLKMFLFVKKNVPAAMTNQTEITHFILMGLTDCQELQSILFVLFLTLYLATLLGNGTILFIADSQLHSPMYFFLGHLSCLDIFYSTVTVPKMLDGFLSNLQTISFSGCMTQLHFFHFLGSTEVLLLGIMACDRCVAICNPLRYTIIMQKKVCLLLATATWSTGFFHALMHAIMTANLSFCGPNHIDHFFCDIKPLLKLACGNTQLNIMLLNIVTSCIAMSPFIIILFSYIYIIIFILFKVQSKNGLQKAFSTCGSHLMVVAMLYVPVFLNYMFPSVGEATKKEMVITLVYSAITPVLNPLIYTLRNQEVKIALQKILKILTFH
uniref:Olfactory receptor n=1 Tax=Salvator merianae TaxID=96440 RepID=A0A8D0E497_SALMN